MAGDGRPGRGSLAGRIQEGSAAGSSPRPLSRKPVFWVAMAAVVAVAALLAAFVTLPSTTGSSHAPPGHASHQRAGASSDSGQSEGVSTTSSGASGCRAQLHAASEAIKRAAASIDQWRLHVTAMNKLVAGSITLDQAMAFWARSQQGAVQRVQSFTDADNRYHSQFPDDRCRGSAPPSCEATLTARSTALASGERSIETWKHHIVNMNMLAAGQLSPTKATRMWVNKWQRGVFQIVDFHSKRKASAEARC